MMAWWAHWVPLLLATCIVLTSAQPDIFVEKATRRIIEDGDIFLRWNYGGGVIMDSLYRVAETFPQIDHTKTVSSKLNEFETNASAYGYKVLHNITIPWPKAIGDTLGLFPIAYLSRALYLGSHYDNRTDMDIVHVVADRYLLGWPTRLPSGVYSRNIGWPGEEGNHSFVWADDNFMGPTLLARLVVAGGGGGGNRDKYLDEIVKQQKGFAANLEDTKDGVYFHGYNNEDEHRSCCKWGRANGWIMMSHVEALQALQGDVHRKEDFEVVLTLFRRHAEGIRKLQSEDGRWHQVLDHPETFLETSCTAMFTTAFVRGVMHGWLPRDYSSVLTTAWRSLQRTLEPDGSIGGICKGTGIQTSVADYEKRSTAYLSSAPGLGSVIYAACDMEHFDRWSRLNP